MSDAKYRYQMYKQLHASIPQIYAEARKVGEEIGITREKRGKFGLTGSVSSCHALLRRDVSEAMDAAARTVIENKNLVDQLREIIKNGYGDDYDCVPINTCEAALWVCFDVLCTPPLSGRGDNYRARYIMPYERHLHHHGGYGRPFPPRYKDLYADRGVTAGEFGFIGKRQENLDVVIVPLPGVDYSCHGIKYYPAPLMASVDVEGAEQAMAKTAERHANLLSGVASMAYDTVGYGYGARDADGTPSLMRRFGNIAKEYNVPYITDNAKGVPFLGVDLRAIGSDVMCYSMDKASGAPTGGLIIGREDSIIQLRRALGMHGERNGNPLSYGKAAYVTMDGGKEYLVGLIAALKAIKEHPEVINGPLEKMYDITVQEFAELPARFQDGIVISKSYNGATVEINYQNTWKPGRKGIPIFSIEDMYAGTALLQSGMAQMGVIPCVMYDANIMITPGLGTTDEDGNLIEDTMRLAVRGLVKLIEIVCKYAGV